MKLSKYSSKNPRGAAKFCQNLQFLISGKYIVQCKLLDTNWLIGLWITAVFVGINRNFNKNDENLMCCFVRREHSSSLINYHKKFNRPQAGRSQGRTITHSNKEKLAVYTDLPDLVITISVPCLWNSDHSSLCSRFTLGSSLTFSSSGGGGLLRPDPKNPGNLGKSPG